MANCGEFDMQQGSAHQAKCPSVCLSLQDFPPQRTAREKNGEMSFCCAAASLCLGQCRQEQGQLRATFATLELKYTG